MLRMFIRFTSVILALTLLACMIPLVESTAEAATISEYGYNLLQTDLERTAYRAIANGIRNCETTIEFEHTVANYDDSIKEQYVQQMYEAAEKALRLVMADHPEFFWFDGDGSLSIYHHKWDGFMAVFETHNYSVNGQPVNKNNVEQYITQVEDAATKILKDMPTDRDLAKIHYLHDYLATNIDYEFGEDDQTIYGALVEGKAVCAGYARAYQYLLNKAGVVAWYVTGYSISPTTMNKVAHAWNLVYLDGKCYYTDVTWDDQEEVFHAYYMLSKAEIGDSHFPDHPEDLPASCGHTDLDYFEVHKGTGTGVGMLTGSYNATELAACMMKVSDDTWSCHVEDLTGGGPQNFVVWLQQNQDAVAAALGIRGGFRWTLDTLWDEYQISFQALPYIHYHDKTLIGQAAKNPTCTESGNIGYFICRSCGAWFENWNGTIEIHDKDSVIIPALDHTFNKTESNEYQHWKTCRDCGIEDPDTREYHYDNNRNGKCDVCNATVEVPTEPTTEPTTQPTTQPTVPPTQEPTEGTTTTPTTNPTEPTVETGTEPTEGNSTEPGSEPSTEPTDSEGTQNTEPTAGSGTEPATQVTQPNSSGSADNNTIGTTPIDNGADDAQNVSMLLPVILSVGIVVVLGAIIVIIIASRRRK